MISLDQYVLQARVVPLVLALFPLGVLVGLLGVGISPLLGAGLALGGPAVLALVGADAVRGLGRDLEARRWDSAGGSPTTLAFLSQDETGTDRRRRLETVTGVRVDSGRPSIERATSVLRDLASDSQRFPRIPIANIAYGRVRNLVALRNYTLVIAAAVDLIVAYLITPAPVPAPLSMLGTGETVLAAALCGLATVFWLIFPTERRLQRAGDDYADRLLAALDVLARNGPFEA